MFKSLSIKKKMTYFIGMVAASIIGAAMFVFFTLNYIDSDYKELEKKSIKSAILTLDIEKSLNYISRTNRDIMLGGNYEKDIQKIEKNLKVIDDNFKILDIVTNDDPDLDLYKKAKKSAIAFAHESYNYIKSLSKDDIKNNKEKIYEGYHHKLSPLAAESRKYFKKYVQNKQKELNEDTLSLSWHISLGQD